MPTKAFFIVLFCVITTQSALAQSTGTPLILRGLPDALGLLAGMLAFFVLSSPFLLLMRLWARVAKKKRSFGMIDEKQSSDTRHSIYFSCAKEKAEIFSTLTLVMIFPTAPLFVALDSKTYMRLIAAPFESLVATASLVSPISLFLCLILGLRSWYLMFLYGSAKAFSFADRRFSSFGFFYYAFFLVIAYAAYRY